MEASRLHTDGETAEAPPGLVPQRRLQNDDEGLETGTPQCKRRRTTASAAPSGSSSLDEGRPSIVEAEDVASEDASYASLVETALSLCLQVMHLTGHSLCVPKVHEVHM